MTTPFDSLRDHMSRSIPFAAHAGVRIDEIGPGTARATLPQTPETANHIGTPHAGAVFTLGETASGAAMASLFADILQTLRPVAATAEIRFLKIARGDLVAVAMAGGDPQALRAALTDEGKVSFPVTVSIRDANDAEVTEMTVAWHVSKARA